MNEVTLDTLSPVPIHIRRPPKVLIPLTPGCDQATMLKMAQWLAVEKPVLLLGIVPVPEGENLSAGAAPARDLRALISDNVDRVNLRAKPRIRVSYYPWEEIRTVLAKESSIGLLVLNWPQQLEALRLTPAEILSHPPCNIAIVRGPLPDALSNILVPMRGGPHAEQALRLALELSGNGHKAKVTSLRLPPTTATPETASAFAGMATVLAEMPGVKQRHIDTEDQSRTILDASADTDLVILGTIAAPAEITTSFGGIADKVFSESPAAVIAVKTKRVVMPEEGSRFGAKAISVLVDRWFAENTFHADEFADLANLMALKEERGVTISLALPALNEADTIGDVIRTVQRSFMRNYPLVDEMVLMDSNSKDRTRHIAAELGVPVFIHQDILPQYGRRQGKGEALWKSLFVTEGDILLWVDTDVRNFHPRFVYGLIGPLLHRQNLQFVKGFYRRPLQTGKKLKAGRGGRVTALTARPLLNLFYPALSGIVQPLAGEYGGRRETLEQLQFSSGYGVETILLIDVYEKFKLPAIGQVDLVERIHRNQSLERLSKMSFAIIQTLFSRLEERYGLEMLQDVNRTMKTVRQDRGQLYLEVEEIAELERPPMVAIPEYRQKRGLPMVESEEMVT